MAKKEEQPSMLQQLRADLKNKQLGRAYIFHGEETFLMQHYLEQVKKLLLDELTESFNFHKLTAETFQLQSFLDSVENLPMMAENTLVWVDEVDLFKLPEGDRERIAQAFEDIPDYCTVIFSYVTTPWKPDKRLTKLWKAIEDNSCIVEFALQEQRDLIPWVTRHFAAAKKQISPDLCAYLIEISGGTMTALSSEIQKIVAFSGAEAITRADIDAVTEPVLDAVVFQMTAQLAQRDYGGALVKLRQLMKMQEEPLKILGGLGMHFRQISAARTVLDAGGTTADLMRICGMRDFAARKAMESARRFSPAFCAKAAELVMETDRSIKTSRDDPQRLLELLILQRAGGGDE